MSLPRPALLFLLLLLLFPAISLFISALQSGFSDLSWWQWALLALLPGLAWLWLRHFSLFGCRDGCRLPDAPSVEPTEAESGRRGPGHPD